MRSTSSRVRSLPTSPILKVIDLAKELERKGEKIIHFEKGEPEFRTPEHILKAIKDALDGGYTKYMPSQGLLELREAIAQKLEDEGIGTDPRSEILVTPGGKHALYLAITSLLEEGDEVLIPEPFFPAYRDITLIAGGQPMFVPFKEEDSFQLPREDLASRVTKRTKMMILNYPGNPTGWVPSRQELGEILDVAVDNDIFVLSDEIYERFVFDGLEHHHALSFDDAREHVVMLNSFSKTYGMTGFRLGYIVAEKDLISQMLKHQQNSITCVSGFIQMAGIAALRGPQGFIEEKVETYRRRRDYAVDRLNKIDGVSCTKPRGAFYVFPNISRLGVSSEELADRILREAGVATVPGTALGDSWDTHLRISLTETDENVRMGIERIAEVMERI